MKGGRAGHQGSRCRTPAVALPADQATRGNFACPRRRAPPQRRDDPRARPGPVAWRKPGNDLPHARHPAQHRPRADLLARRRRGQIRSGFGKAPPPGLHAMRRGRSTSTSTKRSRSRRRSLRSTASTTSTARWSSPAAASAAPTSPSARTPSRPLPRLSELDPAGLTAEQQRVYAHVAAMHTGHVRGPWAIALRDPAVLEHAHALYERLCVGTKLGKRLFELMVLVVARHWTSQFEWHTHEKYAREFGISDGRDRSDPHAQRSALRTAPTNRSSTTS